MPLQTSVDLEVPSTRVTPYEFDGSSTWAAMRSELDVPSMRIAPYDGPSMRSMPYELDVPSMWAVG